MERRRTLGLIRSFGSLRNPQVDGLGFGNDLELSDFGVTTTTITSDRCPRLDSSHSSLILIGQLVARTTIVILTLC